ncbi:dienelactone hydrolase family protein [Psychroserpens sp. SPM9]|uniref:carboxylesterase family protein n=1 Tax=Psychroserpens sp. SPM9 TaxID=2975598 RepID=UPI0021A59586|nr:dienelactone hydrolase family protein [Psychroserpens sp. SPM9]MDG5491943.1 dienelactone hydrolase family protein [Psychroserpens sp. SPM9]
MKTLRPFHLLLLLCFSVSVYAQTTTKDQSKSITVKKYTLKKGKHDVVLKLNNKQHINARLSIPEIKPNQKTPLIIALHWAGDSNAYKEYSNCLAFPALSFLNGIIVAPSDHGLHWTTKENESKLKQLINSIKKHWPIDATKIIITGYSNGAIGSWYYAQKYPELFCASLPVSGTYEASKIKVPLYVIHGKNDELFNAYRVENTITASNKLGSTIQFKLLKEHSHFMGCAYVKALHEMATLLQSEQF